MGDPKRQHHRNHFRAVLNNKNGKKPRVNVNFVPQLKTRRSFTTLPSPRPLRYVTLFGTAPTVLGTTTWNC